MILEFVREESSVVKAARYTHTHSHEFGRISHYARYSLQPPVENEAKTETVDNDSEQPEQEPCPHPIPTGQRRLRSRDNLVYPPRFPPPLRRSNCSALVTNTPKKSYSARAKQPRTAQGHQFSPGDPENQGTEETTKRRGPRSDRSCPEASQRPTSRLRRSCPGARDTLTQRCTRPLPSHRAYRLRATPTPPGRERRPREARSSALGQGRQALPPPVHPAPPRYHAGAGVREEAAADVLKVRHVPFGREPEAEAPVGNQTQQRDVKSIGRRMTASARQPPPS